MAIGYSDFIQAIEQLSPGQKIDWFLQNVQRDTVQQALQSYTLGELLNILLAVAYLPGRAQSADDVLSSLIAIRPDFDLYIKKIISDSDITKIKKLLACKLPMLTNFIDLNEIITSESHVDVLGNILKNSTVNMIKKITADTWVQLIKQNHIGCMLTVCGKGVHAKETIPIIVSAYYKYNTNLHTTGDTLDPDDPIVRFFVVQNDVSLRIKTFAWKSIPLNVRKQIRQNALSNIYLYVKIAQSSIDQLTAWCGMSDGTQYKVQGIIGKYSLQKFVDDFIQYSIGDIGEYCFAAYDCVMSACTVISEHGKERFRLLEFSEIDVSDEDSTDVLLKSLEKKWLTPRDYKGLLTGSEVSDEVDASVTAIEIKDLFGI